MIRPTMSHALNKDHLLELMSKYASYLEEQLAKANERVEKMELMLDGLADYLSDKNKFAIEKQIGVLNELAEADKDGTKHVYYRCLSKIEQLSKEQNND